MKKPEKFGRKIKVLMVGNTGKYIRIRKHTRMGHVTDPCGQMVELRIIIKTKGNY